MPLLGVQTLDLISFKVFLNYSYMLDEVSYLFRTIKSLPEENFIFCLAGAKTVDDAVKA